MMRHWSHCLYLCLWLLLCLLLSPVDSSGVSTGSNWQGRRWSFRHRSSLITVLAAAETAVEATVGTRSDNSSMPQPWTSLVDEKSVFEMPIDGCRLFVCGTLHISNKSIDTVRHLIRRICPDIVVVELCEERTNALVSCLCEEDKNVSLKSIFISAYRARSVRVLASELIALLQRKSAHKLDSPLGGEFVAAAEEARRIRSAIVLGDRSFSITLQRVFDRMTFREKVKLLCGIVWDILVSVRSMLLMDFLQRSDDDPAVILSELREFAKAFPRVAETIVQERDEYLAHSIRTSCRIAMMTAARSTQRREARVVAVIGAGHLPGVRQHLLHNTMTSARWQELRSSSAHHEHSNHTVPMDSVQLIRIDMMESQENC